MFSKRVGVSLHYIFRHEINRHLHRDAVDVCLKLMESTMVFFGVIRTLSA